MHDKPAGASGRMALRAFALTAISLCALVVATAMPAAAFDPAKPVSNRTGSGAGGSGGSGGSGGGGGGGGADHKVALGVAMPYGTDLSALDAHTQAVGGHTPAMWAVWVPWGSHDPAFPTSLALGLRARGVTPYIWWEPVDPNDLSDGTYSRHQNVIDGDHDAYIRQFARAARDFGDQVLLRLAHEMNGSFFPWAVGKFDNSAATFIAMWRHVHDIFQAEGATNVKFVWSVARQGCPGDCNPYANLWPGNGYVDVMGFSAYNWGTFGGKNWNEMYDLYRPLVVDLTAISSKPIMVAETGSTDLGGDKVAWIRDGYREVHERLPEISAIVYLNADLTSDGHPDWRLASPAGALSAYAAIAAMSEFSARSVFSARRNVAARDDARSNRDRKDASEKDRATDPQGRDERGPRVQQGAEVDQKPDADEDKATGNRDSHKKRRKPWEEPPATGADTFGR
jgi:hypothetical protein